MGFFIEPTRGVARAIRRHRHSSEHVLHAPRLAASQIAARRLTPSERQHISEEFDRISDPEQVMNRKKGFAKRLSRWSKGDESAFADGMNNVGNGSLTDSPMSSRRGSFNHDHGGGGGGRESREPSTLSRQSSRDNTHSHSHSNNHEQKSIGQQYIKYSPATFGGHEGYPNSDSQAARAGFDKELPPLPPRSGSSTNTKTSTSSTSSNSTADSASNRDRQGPPLPPRSENSGSLRGSGSELESTVASLSDMGIGSYTQPPKTNSSAGYLPHPEQISANVVQGQEGEHGHAYGYKQRQADRLATRN
jgi:hypothetical protein